MAHPDIGKIAQRSGPPVGGMTGRYVEAVEYAVSQGRASPP